jgi:hypothetical protein
LLAFVGVGDLAWAQDFRPREIPLPTPVQTKNPIVPAATANDAATLPQVTRFYPDSVFPRVAGQAPGGRPKLSEEELEFKISTELPDAQRLFRRESEAQVFSRIRQESRKSGVAIRIIFPEEKPLTKDPYVARNFDSMRTVIEAMYVNHGRLYFEQTNLERQGWDFGILTPVANLGIFYYDVLTLPYHCWTRPCDCCDSSAGKCLPGDPTPLYYYWEEFSWTGLAGQAGTVVGLAFMFP